MANIITSKTRGRIRSQPREYVKLLTDLRHHSKERHQVHNIAPVAGQGEDDVHKQLDDMGSFVNESMEKNREKNRELAKLKHQARESTRRRVINERLSSLKTRDEKSGLAEMARRSLSTKKKRKT